jgi:hypothetical protein
MALVDSAGSSLMTLIQPASLFMFMAEVASLRIVDAAKVWLY